MHLFICVNCVQVELRKRMIPLSCPRYKFEHAGMWNLGLDCKIYCQNQSMHHKFHLATISMGLCRNLVLEILGYNIYFQDEIASWPLTARSLYPQTIHWSFLPFFFLML